MRAIGPLLCVLALAGCDTSDADKSDAETAIKTGEEGAMGEAAPQQNSTLSPANHPTASACAETEATIFSCTIRDGRTVAVCVQRDEQGRQYAQYRFGQRDEPPELAWPTSFDERGMQWASVPYSGGGEAQLSFARGDVRYVIYSRVIRTNFTPGEPNDPRFEDGAYVYRGERRISSLPCAGEAARPVSVAMAERFAEQQDTLFTD